MWGRRERFAPGRGVAFVHPRRSLAPRRPRVTANCLRESSHLPPACVGKRKSPRLRLCAGGANGASLPAARRDNTPQGCATVLPRWLYRRSFPIERLNCPPIFSAVPSPSFVHSARVPQPAGAWPPRGDRGSTAHDAPRPAKAAMAAGRGCRAMWMGRCIVVRSVVSMVCVGRGEPPRNKKRAAS